MKRISRLPVLAGMMMAVMLLSILPLSGLTGTALAAGTMSGTVFQDYNGNGIRDTGGYVYSTVAAPAIDAGIGGVVVTAFDDNGQVGTTTTAANGTYTLNHTGNGTLRVEFSAIPAGFQPGPQGGGVVPDGNPAGVIYSGTTVQFVGATTSGVNLGLIDPDNYCQNNPQVATSCYVAGDPTATGYPTNGLDDAIVTVPASLSGTVSHAATTMQIGSVWGLAYSQTYKNLFSAAFVKRHVGLGPAGIGGLYVTKYVNGAPSTTSTFLNLSALGVNVGTIASNSARGMTNNPTTPTTDADGWAYTGKRGLGDLDLSDDENTLYVVNLNLKTIVRVDLTGYNATGTTPTAANISTISYPAPGCVSGTDRPFGLKFYAGKLYVGVVCDGSGVNPPATSIAPNAALTARVYAYDTATNTWATALSALPLTFQRGYTHNTECEFWQSWSQNEAYVRTSQTGFEGRCWPQPLLSDIEFDNDGSMILGFTDRGAHMLGAGQPLPSNTAPNTFIHGVNGGDIMRARTNGNGTFTIENAGTTASGGGCGTTSIGAPLGQGPGGGEYYCGENFTNHFETSLGGLAMRPGDTDIIMSGIDPVRFESGGLYRLSNTTGRKTATVELYASFGEPGTFGKSAGLGDSELICDAAPIEIGNRLWRDLDFDGIQDPTEPALAGATVRLYAPNGTTVLATAITDANGAYRFSSASGTNTTSARYGLTTLTANTTGFSIRLDNSADFASGGALAGLTLSPANVSSNTLDQRDSDATLVGGFPRITINTGAPGANNHTYDIGLTGFSIGNRVWFDVNNNGTRDAGEIGIANVSVSLFAQTNLTTPLATTTTDANGYYRFDNLAASTYVVRINPSNFQAGQPLSGRFSSTTTEADPNTNADNNDNGIDASNPATNGISSGAITIEMTPAEPTGETDLSATGQGSIDNQANMTVDFGFYEKLSLGNFVWYDTDNDGLFDATEQPITGVTLRLFADTNNNSTLDPADTAVGTDQTTNASGQYLFSGLDSGNYFVQVLPANFTGSGVLVGYSNSTGTSPGDTNNNRDHGTPVAGNGVVSERVTLAYNTEPTTDGDASANTNLTIDFGFYRLSVGNLLWRDDNNDGLRTAGEPGLSGVRVELYTSANTLVAVTTTDANGAYLFSQQTTSGGAGTGAGIDAGDYYVRIPSTQFATGGALAGYWSSTGADAADTTDNNDNGQDDTAPATNGIRSATFTLTPNAEPTVTNATGATANTTIDFGFYTLSLGNLVWNDANNNGVFNAGEQPMQSVAVNLYYDANGDGTISGAETTATASTTTNASGHYLFAGLTAGNYMVELASSNFAAGGVLQGFASSTGTVGAAGAFEPAPDSDTNTADSRDNGTTATPVGGIVVRSSVLTLTAGGEPSSTIETGGNSITNPAPDTNSNLTIDFGVYSSLGIGNVVWFDTNNDGLRNNGELTAPNGVRVNLYYDANGNGSIDGAETTRIGQQLLSGGEYYFGSLVAGNYLVELDAANVATGGLLEGYVSSTGTVGSAAGAYEPAPDPDSVATDDDDNGTTSGGSIRSALVTLQSGSEPTGEPTALPAGNVRDANVNLTVDFGLFRPARIGDFVWQDTNRDGVQDAGEPGIGSVTVRLYDNATSTLLATTTSDANGGYAFTNITAGTYYLVFSNLPANYVFTLQDQGGNNATDSDTDPVSGQTAPFTMTDGVDNLSLDAGAYNDSRDSIGDFVWFDQNENGVQDAGEPGIPGVTVTLYDGAGNDIADVTTDANGGYLFDNLLPDNYSIGVTPPANYAFSPQDAGGNNAKDSDVDATGASAPVTLVPGGSDLTLDAGLYYTRVALGNRVWNDANNDGIDNDAAGIAGVRVRLFAADGTTEILAGPDGILGNADDAAGGMLTDTEGYYLFQQLVPGDYIVEVTTPAGYVSSSGTNGALNGPYEGAALPDPDTNIDKDDNGTTSGAVVRSLPVTLARGSEPTGEMVATANPDTVTPDNNSNLTVDFGFYKPLSLGTTVWHDRNDNGLQDAGEVGIGGVAVQLYAVGPDSLPGSADDTLVASTLTNAAGEYRFIDLLEGQYTVVITPPAGYVSSTDIASSALPDNNIDADDNGTRAGGGSIGSNVISLRAGEEPADAAGFPAGNLSYNPTVDFGLYQPLTLGNIVWDDRDNNGTRDAGEPGIDGVTVNLYHDDNGNGTVDAGEFVASTITSGGGFYAFTNLRPDDYIVGIPASTSAAGGPLESFASSTGGTGEPATDPDNNTNDDDNGTVQSDLTVVSGVISLVSGDEPTDDGDADASTNLTLDFGFYQLASLGDRVWLDANRDGVQDAGEMGVAGVSVALYRPGPDGLPGTADDSVVDTTTTGADGSYVFIDLVPGDYFIVVTPPLGYVITGQDSLAATDLTDSDVSTTSGASPVVALLVGDSNDTIDAGLVYTASLGDRVWHDLNGNGVQDAGEPGLPGVTVELLTTGGTIAATATTDANGNYMFPGVAPDTYTIRVTPPATYVFSPQDQQSDDSADSDIDPATGKTAPIIVGLNTLDQTHDAGLYQPVSLGNVIWHDANNNGRLDAGEQGLAGATVTLYTAAGVQVGAPATTTATGQYLFTGLRPGQYYVEVVPPAGYVSSSDIATSPAPDDNIDSDDNGIVLAGTAWRSATITLSNGAEPSDDGAQPAGNANVNLTLDFGFYQPLSIGNVVWADTDNNGVRGAAETGIDGVTVKLYRDVNGDGVSDTGELIDSTTTAGGGVYQFTDLEPGTYLIEIPAADFAPAGPLESYASSTGGSAEPAPAPDTDINDDDNGTAQPNGTVLSGPITLVSGAEPVTDGDTNASTNNSIDFGFYPLAGIGNYIWIDADRDGVQDAGEAGLPGITVSLYRPGPDGAAGTPDDLLVATATSGAGGAYAFSKLPDGDYFVRVDLPMGYVFSPVDSGGNTPVNDQTDSDADPVSGLMPVTTLLPGENDSSWDAGLIYTASLGDRVWLDQNANGVQDAGEPGVPNVTVELYTDAGVLVDSVQTDANGNYSFSSLSPGEYVVNIVAPGGYDVSSQDQGSDDGADSDIDPLSGETAPITIALGSTNATVDAGLYRPVALGDTIWNDLNNNGLFDASEVGVDGVVVNLYRDINGNGQIDSGEFVDTETTAGGGAYLFADLIPGSYIVQIDPANFTGGGVLVGYRSSSGSVGTTPAPTGPYEPAPSPDSDINRNDDGSDVAGLGIVSAPVTLLSGGEPTTDGDSDVDTNLSVDFGVFMPSSLGNLVWDDTDRDGVYDAGERGVAGVTVEIYDQGGNLVASTTTDAAGRYGFTNLAPGTYTLRFTGIPQGMAFTLPDQGGNEANDSDVDPATGRTASVTLVPGANVQNVFAGVYSITPTAIQLESFTASKSGTTATIQWKTAAEWNTLGFHLYRSTDGVRATAVKVTTELILARGSGSSGALYEWQDTGLDASASYTYWLVEVETNGTRTEYGPVSTAPKPTGSSFTLFLPMVGR